MINKGLETDRQTDRQTDIQTDRQTDRDRDRETERKRKGGGKRKVSNLVFYPQSTMKVISSRKSERVEKNLKQSRLLTFGNKINRHNRLKRTLILIGQHIRLFSDVQVKSAFFFNFCVF